MRFALFKMAIHSYSTSNGWTMAVQCLKHSNSWRDTVSANPDPTWAKLGISKSQTDLILICLYSIISTRSNSRCSHGRGSESGRAPIARLQAGPEASFLVRQLSLQPVKLPLRNNSPPVPQAKPCHHDAPKRTPPPQRSLLQGSPAIHKVRSTRLPLEPLQRRSHSRPVLRQAAAAHPAQHQLALLVPPAAAEDHDGRAGQALPVARGSRGPGALEQRAVEDARGHD